MAVEKRPNFLVVENDPNDAFFIRRALAPAGAAHVCKNPEEARAYLSGSGSFQDRTKYPLPELILTDLRMDQHCGLKFVQWLRNQPSPLRETNIVILTGSANATEYAAAEKIGAQQVLCKPTSLDDLKNLVSGLVRQFCPSAGK